MSILVNEQTSVLIQGITGSVGRTMARKMLEDGTRLVAGVVPGKGGQSVDGVPVYDSVHEAAANHPITASFLAVPARFVKDSALEALQAGAKLVVIYSEGVPMMDSLVVRRYARCTGAFVFGPNSAGIMSPGRSNVSDLNLDMIRMTAGPVGVISKSGTLTYEVVLLLSELPVGFSTVACLGSDEIIGTSHVELLKRFERDPETKLIVLLGEPGGDSELEAAKYIPEMRTPVVAYVSGHEAPADKPMGHSGAIVRSEGESAKGKTAQLARHGALCATCLEEIPEQVRRGLDGNHKRS